MSGSATPPPAPPPPRLRGSPAGALLFASLTVLALLLLVSVGHERSADRANAVINAIVLSVHAGLLAGVYFLAAMGFGRPIVALLRRAKPASPLVWLQAPLGLCVLLWCSHLAGMLGLLSGPNGAVFAWAILAPGLLLLADQVVRGPLRPERWSPLPPAAALAAPGLGVLLAAACSPPGALWLGASSEGGGYDVLSYHLQLPKEWAASGARLWPLEHNVYSFLPGYLEGAYLHVAAMLNAGGAHGGNFVEGSGVGVIATQFLHALLGALTALLVARAVLASTRDDTTVSASTHPACVAGAAFLCIPWVMVVGSLAYNELGVTAMFAGALVATLTPSLPPWARGAATGLLVGIACSIKPTSLLFVAPTSGLFLLFARPIGTRERVIATLAGCVTGLIAIAPWLVRNWLASGNPVFPFAAGVFGHGHWTPERLARYAAAHSFHGSTLERISLLFDPTRGILNEQWAIAFPVGGAALAIVIISRHTRRLGVLLALGLFTQLLAWLFLTHLQSRFLLVCAVPLTIAMGLATREVRNWAAARTGASPGARLAGVVAALVPLSLGAWSWMIFLSQRGGRPNELLAADGVPFLTGQAFAAPFGELRGEALQEALLQLPPAPFVNFTLPDDRAVYFLGGATPLYFVPRGGVPSIVYHTTWDHNPLAEAIRQHPDEPARWTEGVRDASRGRPIDFVLVDLDELARLYPRDPAKQVWFDPDVTPERLNRWLQQECELVRGWPTGEGTGTFLFRLKPATRGTP